MIPSTLWGTANYEPPACARVSAVKSTGAHNRERGNVTCRHIETVTRTTEKKYQDTRVVVNRSTIAFAPIIPCHGVLSAHGKMHGFSASGGLQ